MKGWSAVEENTAATQAARDRAQQSTLPDLKVNARRPGPYVIRFCEQGNEGPHAINSFYVHAYNEPDGKGGWYNRYFTCLTEVGVPSNQCPGCIAGLKRKVRGVYNVIERQRPILRRDPATKKAIKTATGDYIIDGHQDQVVVANVGGPTAEMLRKLDGNMGGLMSRDWIVSYSGDNFQAWAINAQVDSAGNSMATSMSESDLALFAAKHDLDAYMKPPTVQDAQQIVNQFGANSGAQTQQAPPPAIIAANPMLAGADLGTTPFNPLAAVTGQPAQQQ